MSDDCLSRLAKGLRLLATASRDQAGRGLFVQQPIYDTASVRSDIVSIANGPGRKHRHILEREKVSRGEQRAENE